MVGRIGLDVLRSRQAHPEAFYDDRLPELVVTVDEIGQILGRSTDAAKMLAGRARGKVRFEERTRAVPAFATPPRSRRRAGEGAGRQNQRPQWWAVFICILSAWRPPLSDVGRKRGTVPRGLVGSTR
ncbi:hypothetical protein AB0I09_29365, partial [Streptosporangium canum]